MQTRIRLNLSLLSENSFREKWSTVTNERSERTILTQKMPHDSGGKVANLPLFLPTGQTS